MDFFDTNNIGESFLSIVRLSLVIIMALSGFLIDLFLEEWSGRSSAIFRNCRSFKSLRQEYGCHFWQAYRISYPSFRQLLHIIEDDIRSRKRFWSRNGTIQPDI
jgi:hypothetical protein